MFLPSDETTFQHSQCPVCGGHDFEWGRLAGQAYYVPSTNMWAMKGRQVVKVRRCLRCNAMMPFGDPTMTRQFNRVMAIIVVVAVVIAFAIAALSIFLASSPLPK